MGNLFASESPPPVVLVPPFFTRPQLATRSRMTESSYEILFSKLAREHLFKEYYGEIGTFMGRIMLKPADDPSVDITATVFTPLNESGELKGNAIFRWQRNALDPSSFAELKISTDDKALQVRSCLFCPATGLGVFANLPFFSKNRAKFDQGIVGVRYASSKLSIGTTMSPLQSVGMEAPTSLWVVSRLGQITAGCQFKRSLMGEGQEKIGLKYQLEAFQNPSNWSFAVDYGSGLKGPLKPSFNFCVEVSNNSKLSASYYHHLVVQRKVKNPFESDTVVAITNYIDIGFEFHHRLEVDKTCNSRLDDEPSTMQIAGSWQANKNILLKAKVGVVSSGIALAFKSWWQPSFTLSFAVVRDHLKKVTGLGFGVQVENFGDVSYERADPNYVMITPTKEHLADGVLKNLNQRPMLWTDVAAGNFEALPAELCPSDVFL